MISLKNVSKWYGHFQVLTDCSTEVKKGEVVVVCGPSGSGKSTLIKTVNGLEPVQQGEIIVNGTRVPIRVDSVAAVRALRELLAAGYGTEARPIASYGAPAPGTLGGVYPDYDDRVFPGLVAAQELAGIDVDYLRNVDRVSEAGIAEASLADLGTLFTYLVRGERFADGHVAAAIENGKVGRMLDRLTALVPEIR